MISDGKMKSLNSMQCTILTISKKLELIKHFIFFHKHEGNNHFMPLLPIHRHCNHRFLLIEFMKKNCAKFA